MVTARLSFYDGSVAIVDLGQEIPYFFCFADECLFSCDFEGSCSSVPPFAFFGCVRLRCVTLPAGVFSICVSAFEGCASLMPVDLKNVKSLGPRCFKGCHGTHPPSNSIYVHHTAFAGATCKTHSV